MSDTDRPAEAQALYGLLVLAAGDDIAVAVRDLTPGSQLTSDGRTLELTGSVALGHKVAVRDIAVGEPIVRFGMVIGSATATVAAGGWVHTHNLVSNYIVTFAHRGGEA